MNGEDGLDGTDGAGGADASETLEARAGSDGGHGGNAGHGGNGGDGGNCGTIEILVHEDQVHLLMAVQWDLSGGKGGQPGRYSQPGCGGKGGKGGKEHEWKQRVGYDYICTSRCVGGDTTTNSSSLVRYSPVTNMRRTLEFARTGAQMMAGSNSAQLMIRATRLQENRSPNTNPGAESKVSMDWTAVPVFQAQKPDGSRQEYNSLYSLALADFDVEDENGDGIFEPGEHIFVRRIKVLNSALNTVAQGSQSKLSFEVYNHGNVSIGPHGYNSRVVEVDVSFPADFGELESEPDQWRESVTIIPDDIQSGVVLTFKRQLRVHSHAPSYQHVVATFKLYLGKPNQCGPDGKSDLDLVHVVEIRMQVSDEYVNHSGASFLLVTNSETGSERAQSIRRYINNSLGMEYSGVWENILSRYHGRTIIFLGNQFSFSGQGRKTIFDICDPEVIATAAANNTNLLFLDTPDFEPHEKLIREAIFWPSQSVSCFRANISQSHQFHSVADFVTAVAQQKQYYNLSHERFAITLSKKWYWVASLGPATIAKKVVNQLQRKLPTERFLITFYETSPLDIIITAGIPHQNSMAALEQLAQEHTADTSASDGLPLTEAYMIVEAITLNQRISLLWDTAARSMSNGNSVALHSQLAIEALTTSLIRATHCELEMMLHKAPWPDTLLPSNPSKHSFEQLKTMFASHLPTLHDILFHPQASEPTVVVNDNVQLVLSYALATTRPQLKRQIAAHVLTPTHNRRRRAHTFLRAGISMLLRNKGFTENHLSDFFSRASQVHMLSNPTKRNTSAEVLRMIASLTKRSEHAVVRGKQDTTDLVRNSSYLAPGDWDSRATAVKERSRKVTEEAEEARRRFNRMIVS
ncbi:hypothetical protein F5Y03DRAFT_401513 [Xylaria venustula]|nr:hypothetical protein F5Y03DRAFT_401513 [Xylaria venustula]